MVSWLWAMAKVCLAVPGATASVHAEAGLGRSREGHAGCWVTACRYTAECMMQIEIVTRSRLPHLAAALVFAPHFLPTILHRFSKSDLHGLCVLIMQDAEPLHLQMLNC